MSQAKAITPFPQRIAKYGLDLSDIQSDTLRVGRKQVTCLGSLGRKPSFYPPRFLKAAGVDDVKQWIGTPDEIIKVNPKMAKLYAIDELPSEHVLAAFDRLHHDYLEDKDAGNRSKKADRIRALLKENRKSLRGVSRAYVYGDSGSVASWRTLLDWNWRDFVLPLWLFNTVIVENGSVLELDEGRNILAGDTLVIEQGGTIRSSRTLNIDFTNIKRSL